MINEVKKKTFSGLVYAFGERIGAQLVSFVVSLVLARILLPEQYGTVALVTVLISLFNVFVTQGMGSALIQNKNSTENDFSTAFWANLVFSLLIYIIIFLCAPYVGTYYDNQVLCPVLRVMGVKIILASFNSIQQAYISKRMEFKKFFYATLVGTIISALVGIAMALKGFGVWSLVAQYLTNSTIDTVMLSIQIKWKPRFCFSIVRFKKMFSFGSKILFAGVIDELYNQIRTLIIGRLYSTADLAYYNKGQSFPSTVMTNINSAINTVMFPVMSSSDRDGIKAIQKKMLKISSFVLFPLMGGLAMTARALIILLLTEKWLDCVVYLQIFCAIYALFPIITLNKTVLKSIGESGVYLKIEVIKKIIFVSLLMAFMRLGVKWIALSMLMSIFLETWINATACKKYVNYGWLEQIKDIIPATFLTGIMCVSVWGISFLGLSTIFELFVQIVVGMVVYLLLALLFGFDEMKIIIIFIKEKSGRRE